MRCDDDDGDKMAEEDEVEGRKISEDARVAALCLCCTRPNTNTREHTFVCFR